MTFYSPDNKYMAMEKSLLYLVKKLVKSGVAPERIAIRMADFPGAQVIVQDMLIRCHKCGAVMESTDEVVDMDDEMRLSITYKCRKCGSELHTEFIQGRKK